MKKKHFFYFLLFSSSLLVAQGNVEQLVTPTLQYESDIHIDENGEKALFNDKMLNILFANKVGTSFGGSNDLTLQKFYTSLDANDNSLAIGANFEWQRDDETEKLTWLLSAGAKIKADNKFATIYDNGDFQENSIGVTLKITHIGNGKINFNSCNSKKDRKSAVINHRDWLCDNYDKKVEKFNKESLQSLIDKTKELSIFDPEYDSINKVLEKKNKELYVEMAKEEIAYIEKNKMYNFVSDKWWSFEVYVPFGENKYKTTSDIAINELSNRHFYAFNATFSWNYMREYSAGQSFFLKLKGNLKNNNNILVDNLKTTAFQATTIGAGGNTIILNTDNGYITEFKQFLTPSLLIEPAFFTFNNSIGFSPAVEFNQGKYCKTNWKLGIPVSLKDKDGKPKVNFEVQWKEINTFNSSSHLVGISANFVFGELIN